MYTILKFLKYRGDDRGFWVVLLCLFVISLPALFPSFQYKG